MVTYINPIARKRPPREGPRLDITHTLLQSTRNAENAKERPKSYLALRLYVMQDNPQKVFHPDSWGRGGSQTAPQHVPCRRLSRPRRHPVSRGHTGSPVFVHTQTQLLDTRDMNMFMSRFS